MAALNFEIKPNPSPRDAAERNAILANPGFGQHFTDHMVLIDWDAQQGWHNARVEAYGPIPMDPSTSVLHYGQSIFEGMKAYRHDDGSIVSFRPDQNAKRFQRSAERIAMPFLPEDLFLEAVRQLVDIDQEWVPAAGSEESLYLRPLMFATEQTLGVHPSNSYTFLLIASPAGSYFSGGINPVTVWLSHEYVRACPGGTGAAKFAGNYAASLAAQAEAEKHGCDQVVWLDAIERTYIEEMGGMNLAFIYGTGDDASNLKLVTPALSGSLLPGITRDSLLTVAEDMGMHVEQSRVSTADWENDAVSGEMSEAFACGTAAVITPVGTVHYRDGSFQINGATTGEWTMKLRERLTGIQHGTVADTHGWVHTLVPAT
ncbi:branched-chain amino acid aminotransferase [Corynebacterium sp. TAE3-ERU12]|uniref:branched-chain amino acid aminotransferase n=1 Tax=Corynebacterium sp. TAE3-ERU12 TaxID=2849491 RepID=UPI001C46C26F|nr:branched-chain amino acid aminotransferase [Corynebacterium sp. TAE3-ERU12]MBV7296265.1 branched-chain amino acid aminotransferase [Corynebacterium sp. TAE3-ERU12]